MVATVTFEQIATEGSTTEAGDEVVPGWQGDKAVKWSLADFRTILGAGGAIILTPHRAVATNGDGEIIASTVSDTELGYLEGVTGPIQTQIGNRQPININLTAIASLSGTGVLVRNGEGDWTLEELSMGDASAANQLLQLAQEELIAAALGAPDDAAYTGTGDAAAIAILKGIFGKNTIVIAAGTDVIGRVGLQVGGSDVGSGNGIPILPASGTDFATDTKLDAVITAIGSIPGGGGSVSIDYDGNPVGPSNRLPVDASLDPTGLATEAKQDTIITALGDLADIKAAVEGATPAGTNVIGKTILRVGSNDVDATNRVPVDLSTTTVPLPTGAGTAANQSTINTSIGTVNTSIGTVNTSIGTTNTNIGAPGATAANADTGSFSLNAMFQRLLSRVTALIALFPSSIGQKNTAGSLSVTLSSDHGALTMARQQQNVVSVTVSSGQTVSATADCSVGRPAILYVPNSTFDGTTISFKISYDNSTFMDLYDKTNTQVSMTVAQNRAYALDPAIFLGARYIQIVCGTTQSTTSTVFQLVCEQ